MNRVLAFSILVLFGCLKPDTTGPGQSAGDNKIEDKTHLAGATSSTNWPQEDAGGLHLGVQGRTDSNLTLYFRELFAPRTLTGKVSVFLGGTIPALDTIPVRRLTFSDQDSVIIPASLFLSLGAMDKDTLLLSIRVELDTAQCLLLGFTYSRKDKIFMGSPFSLVSGVSYPLLNPKYSMKGKVDSLSLNSSFPVSINTEWCFYIPGTPYFWKAGIDSILEIGPLPFGEYPIRLLRLMHPDGKASKEQVEIFEMNLGQVIVSGQNSMPEWKLGEKILSSSIDGSISIRSNNP